MKKLNAGRTTTLLLALTLADGASDGISAQTLVPERIGSVEVPLSTSQGIALLSDETTACVIDSYEVRVRCVNRSGDVVGVFGREGEGPGAEVDAEVECGKIIYGFPNPGGGWVHVACEGHMVFVAEGGDVAVLQAPTYTGELPNERDVEWWEGAGRSARRMGVDWDREMEEIRSTPKHYHLLFGQQKFDQRGRLWIATQRDRDEFSYLDVYLPGEAAFFGNVRVSDRVMGFDLLGSTLVVVVERQLPPDDLDGIAERRVDWYDISELWP